MVICILIACSLAALIVSPITTVGIGLILSRMYVTGFRTLFETTEQSGIFRDPGTPNSVSPFLMHLKISWRSTQLNH